MTDAIREPFVLLRVGHKVRGKVQLREVSSSLIRKIKSVSITRHEKKASTGTLTLDDRDAIIFDSKLFKKRTLIMFIIGHTDDLAPRGPFYVKNAYPTFDDRSDPVLEVKFQDLSHKLNRKQKQKRHVNLRPDQILKRIAKEHGLAYDIETVDGVVFTDDFPLIQANVTDAALIQRLASRYGYVWGVEGGTLYFRRPLDADKSNKQGEVPVLSYGINLGTLKSFSPKIKYSSGRKRKGSKKTLKNIDFDKGELFGIEGTRESIQEITEAAEDLPGVSGSVTKFTSKVTELLGVESGEEVDDEEPTPDTSKRTDAQTSSKEAKKERTKPTSVWDDLTEMFIDEPGITKEDMNEESEPGDEDGSATPETKDEAKRRAASKVARASEIIEGTAVPIRPDVSWYPGKAVLLTGIGERLAGKYRVRQVTETITRDQGFALSLEVQKRTFKAANKDKSKIAKETDDASKDKGSGKNAPPKITYEETEEYDPNTETWTYRKRRVDGQKSE